MERDQERAPSTSNMSLGNILAMDRMDFHECVFVPDGFDGRFVNSCPRGQKLDRVLFKYLWHPSSSVRLLLPIPRPFLALWIIKFFGSVEQIVAVAAVPSVPLHKPPSSMWGWVINNILLPL